MIEEVNWTVRKKLLHADLSKTTVLVGAAGSGKSSLIQELGLNPRAFRFYDGIYNTLLRVKRDRKDEIEQNLNALDIGVVGFRWCVERYEVELAGFGWVPGSWLSDGIRKTVDIVAISVSGIGGGDTTTLLFDDVDSGIHPKVAHKLGTILRKSRFQVVASTHSPFFCDAMDAESVLVLAANAEKACCERLSDHYEWNRWKPCLNTGEFWTFVGDTWPLKDRDAR